MYEPPAAPLVARCPWDRSWDGRSCRGLSADTRALELGRGELGAFRPEEAGAALDRARRLGPYRHRDYVRLYEQTGIAHAYLDREAQALEAFDMVLALEPGYAISYTLSPKVTFVFERARRAAESKRAPELRVVWPRQSWADAPVPVDIEVVADPKRFLHRARLHWRRKGEPGWRFADLDLPPPRQQRRVVVPAVASEGATRAEVLELFVSAYDREGNEVLVWGDAAAPRDVPLAARASTPWYGKWWVWGIAAGVAALATGIAVGAATQEPPDRVGGTASAR